VQARGGKVTKREGNSPETKKKEKKEPSEVAEQEKYTAGMSWNSLPGPVHSSFKLWGGKKTEEREEAHEKKGRQLLGNIKGNRKSQTIEALKVKTHIERSSFGKASITRERTTAAIKMGKKSPMNYIRQEPRVEGPEKSGATL